MANEKATFWPRRDPTTGKYEQVRPVVMTFPKLIVAEKFKGSNGKESGEPKFSANFLFPLKWPDGSANADLGNIGRLVEAVAHARWPGRNIRDAREFKLPWVLGDTLADKAAAKKKDGEYQRGCVVLTARSGEGYPPVLSGILPGGRLDLYDTDELRQRHKAYFYFGCYVLPYFSFKSYDGVGANPDGVNAYLQGVTTLNKGTRIGGNGVDVDSFQGYIGQDSEVDPTVGLAPNAQFADAIPF